MRSQNIEIGKLGIAVCCGILAGDLIRRIYPGFIAVFLTSVFGILVAYTVMDRVIERYIGHSY